MKGQRLQVVDKFTYLGSTLSRVVHIDDEVNARIAKASAAFGRLRGSIWDRSGIRLDTKLKVYRSVVLPTLLYACETWTVYQRHAKRLNHFHTSCLRKLLKSKWQDRIPDTEVLKSFRHRPHVINRAPERVQGGCPHPGAKWVSSPRSRGVGVLTQEQRECPHSGAERVSSPLDLLGVLTRVRVPPVDLLRVSLAKITWRHEPK